MEQKTLISHIDAERELLGQLVTVPDCYTQVSELLTASDFYSPACRRAYEAVEALQRQDGTAGLVAVHAWLTAHPDGSNPAPADLVEWTQLPTTAATAMQNAALVKDAARRRSLWALGSRLMAAGTDDDVSIDDVERDMARELEHTAWGSTGVITSQEANRQLSETIDTNRRKDSGELGLPTGLAGIDHMAGLHRGDLVVIAADTSQGKTTLAVNMATAAAGHGHPVMFYSMEMGAVQLAARINAPFSNVPSHSMLYRQLTDVQVQSVRQAMALTGGMPLYFDERSTSTIDGIISGARSAARRLGAEMVVVDYLQILSTTQRVQNNELFMGEVARRLKNLAKRENVCVLALSQLSRDRDNPQPSLSKLRASGQIAEAADMVMLIYRPEAYGRGKYPGRTEPVQGTAMITVAKNRNGETGDVVVDFDRATSRFSDYDPARHTATPGGTPAPYPDPGAQPAAWNGSQAAPF